MTEKPREHGSVCALAKHWHSVAMFSQVLSILPALPNIEGVS